MNIYCILIKISSNTIFYTMNLQHAFQTLHSPSMLLDFWYIPTSPVCFCLNFDEETQKLFFSQHHENQCITYCPKTLNCVECGSIKTKEETSVHSPWLLSMLKVLLQSLQDLCKQLLRTVGQQILPDLLCQVTEISVHANLHMSTFAKLL